MANQYTKWDRYFQRLNIIFHGVVAISMIPFAYAFLETQKDFADAPILGGKEAMILKFGLIGITLITLLIAFRFNRRNTSDQSRLELVDRLKLYANRYLWFYLIVQFAAVTACLGLYLLKDQFFSFLYVVVLFVFSQTRPTYDRVVKENKLTEEEIEELNELSDG